MDYYECLKEELIAKYKGIDQLTKHSKIRGDYHEALIRDLVQKALPIGCKVGHGIVYNEKDQASKECDIVVYDVRQKQPLFKSGDLVVVDAEQVNIVMQVKSTIDSGKLKAAEKNLRSIHEIDPHIQSWVVGFKTRVLLKTLYLNAWQNGIINFLYAFTSVPLENKELLESQMRFFAENLSKGATKRNLAKHLFIYMGKRDIYLHRPADINRIQRLVTDIYERGFWTLYKDESYSIPQN